MATITVTKHHADRVKSLKADLVLLENALKAIDSIRFIMPTAGVYSDIRYEIEHTKTKIAELSN